MSLHKSGFSRREWLRASIAGGAFAMLAPWQSVLAGAGTAHMVTIPSSGQKIPCVGLGTNRYRGDVSSSAMQPLKQTLKAFHEMGATVLDTSPNYGNSEEVLGHLLTELEVRDKVFMATKVDREDADDGLERMTGSFERLGSPIELMQVHNLRGTEEQLPQMQEWKSQGRFRYVGITTHRVSQHDEMEQVMRNHDLDFIQVNYSMADRAAEQRILPLAQEKGIAVLVNRPFGNGKLFGAVKGQELPAWAAEIDAKSWGQVFLKYIISHPSATCPIPGTTKPHHAKDNAGAMYGAMPDAEMRKVMEKTMDDLI